MKDGLDGLVALVTGAGGGIGSAIAIAMANSGAKVAVEDLDAERAKMVSDSICQSGGIAIDLSARLEVDDGGHLFGQRVEVVEVKFDLGPPSYRRF